ncbi:Zn-dependent hydrolases of the beta-lactamase protein [Penicillium herquei]|nr:Zn-dependent hydrolases of the beta-lactamase protein [Penicillium herquei]
MSPSSFRSSFSITHIGTATAIFEIDNVNLLTDPFFSPAGTTWDVGGGITLKNTETPALGLENLPVIDAVLLSHEDHPDNLDDFGRQLLNGRHVFTTVDGGKNLAPRPAVRGMKPWETTSIVLGGKKYDITATPCQHLPGGECTGFILTTADFGVSPDGRPNAIYFTGDTVYIDELAKIPEMFHIVAAVMNLGSAHAPLPDGPLQITMDGKQAAHLFRTIKADCLVPMHYESWGHFTQFGKDLIKVFEEEGISKKVRWLAPGKSVKIL